MERSLVNAYKLQVKSRIPLVRVPYPVPGSVTLRKPSGPTLSWMEGSSERSGVMKRSNVALPRIHAMLQRHASGDSPEAATDPPSQSQSSSSCAATVASASVVSGDVAGRADGNGLGQILTHQEKRRLRTPKRKADAWPESIRNDDDVLSLDEEGRYVLCRVCHVHYAVHGGKKPKPVIMNASFRVRAWEVHKERTNSHRRQQQMQLESEQEQSESASPSHSFMPSEQREITSPAQRRNLLQEGRYQEEIGRINAVQVSSPPPQTRRFPPTSGSPLPQLFARPRINHSKMAKTSQRPRNSRAIAEENDDGAAAFEATTHLQNDVKRWRNMHDTVSRALSSVEDHQSASGSAGSQSDTEAFSATSEQMTRRLQVLNSEYEDKSFSQINVNPSSSTSREYWCRLREAFTSKPSNSKSKSRHSKSSSATQLPSDHVLPGPIASTAAEPNDAAFKQIHALHDQRILNEVEQLSSMLARESRRQDEESAARSDAFAELMNVVRGIRDDDKAASNRLIALQEQRLGIMKNLLETMLAKGNMYDTP